LTGAFFAAACLAGAAFLVALTGALLVAALLAAPTPLLAATLVLLAFVSFALGTGFPLCALAGVALRVVFAISLHHFWPWRPGVIAHVSNTGNHASGILRK
jgi:hypothetical protein